MTPAAYANHRGEIRSGDLLAWSHRGWGSLYDLQVQAVRMFTRSEYCHVGIAWVIGGRVLVLEAVSAGVRIMPLSSLLPCYWLPLSVAWNWVVEDFALARVGERYSRWQAVLAGLRLLKPGEDRLWQCAEYAWMNLAHAGTDLGPVITPSGLVAAAQRLGAPCFYLED